MSDKRVERIKRNVPAFCKKDFDDIIEEHRLRRNLNSFLEKSLIVSLGLLCFSSYYGFEYYNKYTSSKDTFEDALVKAEEIRIERNNIIKKVKDVNSLYLYCELESVWNNPRVLTIDELKKELKDKKRKNGNWKVNLPAYEDQNLLTKEDCNNYANENPAFGAYKFKYHIRHYQNYIDYKMKRKDEKRTYSKFWEELGEQPIKKIKKVKKTKLKKSEKIIPKKITVQAPKKRKVCKDNIMNHKSKCSGYYSVGNIYRCKMYPDGDEKRCEIKLYEDPSYFVMSGSVLKIGLEFTSSSLYIDKSSGKLCNKHWTTYSRKLVGKCFSIHSIEDLN